MTTISGKQNMATYRAMVIRSGLGLMQKGIKPTRQWTKRLALANANAITGKAARGYDEAIADLSTYISEHPAINNDEEQWT